MRATLRMLWILIAAGGLPGRPAVGQSTKGPHSPAADDDAMLQRIVDRWESRVGQFCSAGYQLRGESWHAAGSSIPPDDPDFKPGEIPETVYPIEENTTPLVLDWLIDFERGMLRRDSEDVSFTMRNRAFRPFVRTEVFDGERPVGHWPPAANTSLNFTPGRYYADIIFWGPGERSALWTDLPVFHAHGLTSV